MSSVLDAVIKFLTGDFPYSTEVQALGMALQGALAVRNGRNRDGSMAPFHAFALSSLVGFGGGWFGFIWLGKPSSMFTSDINMGSCILSYLFVNSLPFDVGLKLGNFLPFTIVVTSCAQLFRALGMMRFITTAMAELGGNATAYYPMPVFGPILYGAMLGNMGSLFLKGLDGHLANGMPFPFQNGIIMGTFFHFFVNDSDGPIGSNLRSLTYTLTGGPIKGMDDRMFAMVFVSLFMQVAGILQLPAFFGPSYSPLRSIVDSPITISKSLSMRSVAPRSPPVEEKKAPVSEPTTPQQSTNETQKKKRKRKKKTA